jgi:hypothetical protein
MAVANTLYALALNVPWDVVKYVLGTNFAERFFSDILTLIIKIILLKNVFDINFLRTLVTRKLIKNS